MVIWGQPEVKLLRNALLPPTWLEEPLTRVEHIASVQGHAGSCRVNYRSNCLQMSYGHQIWSEEALTKPTGVKGHALEHMQLQVL